MTEVRRDVLGDDEIARIESKNQMDLEHADGDVFRLIASHRALAARVQAVERERDQALAIKNAQLAEAQGRVEALERENGVLGAGYLEIQKVLGVSIHGGDDIIAMIAQIQATLAERERRIQQLEDQLTEKTQWLIDISQAVTWKDSTTLAQAVVTVVKALEVQRDAAVQQVARLRETALWAMKKVKRLSTRAVDYKRADDFIQHEQALKGA